MSAAPCYCGHPERLGVAHRAHECLPIGAQPRAGDYCPGTGTPARGHAVCPVCSKLVPSRSGRLRRHVPPTSAEARARVAAKLDAMRSPACPTCGGAGVVPVTAWRGDLAARPGYLRRAYPCPDCAPDAARLMRLAEALEAYEAPELPHDPTGVDCAERYEGGDV